MADGVRKTFRKTYRDNVIRAMELLTDFENPESTVREMTAALFDEQGLFPTLEPNEAYLRAEAEKLAQLGLDGEAIARVQSFAQRRAVEETDRATYQAMEALIHNLNTMNSRAGAQVPFSSINYGMDTSPEARMAIRNLLLTTEAGLGNGETPIFPIQIFRVKEGISYNPGDPNYDLFKLAMPHLGQAPVPEFLLPGRAVQPEVLQGGPSGDRNRLHGLPHPRHRQRLRSLPGDLQRPRQPELHVHQPAPPGHQSQP